MSVARTVVSRPTASRHASLRLDAPRLLLLAANLVGGLCVVASLFDWGGAFRRAPSARAAAAVPKLSENS